MQFIVREPFVLREEEVNPQGLQVFRLSSLNSLQVLEQGLISLFNMLSNHITVRENLQPELRDLLFSEVVVLGFLFLLSEELSNFLEVRVSECVLSLDDGIHFIDVGEVLFSEFSLDGFLLSLQFLVELSLFDEVVVDGNGLNFFMKSGQFLNLLFNLFFDLELNKGTITSSSEFSASISSSDSSTTSFFFPLELINNQDISITLSPYMLIKPIKCTFLSTIRSICQTFHFINNHSLLFRFFSSPTILSNALNLLSI